MGCNKAPQKKKCSDHLYRPQKVRPKSNDLEVGIFMAKYSFEFKKKVVLEYLDGKRWSAISF